MLKRLVPLLVVALLLPGAAQADSLSNAAAMKKATGLPVTSPAVVLTEHAARRAFTRYLRATMREEPRAKAPWIERCGRKDSTTFRCVGQFTARSCPLTDDVDLWTPCAQSELGPWETLIEAARVERVSARTVIVY